MNLAKQLAAVLVFVLAGCASNPGIVATGGDTYTLSRTDRGGSFDNIGTTKADLIREANQFAAGRGMAAVQVAMKENHLIAPEGYTNVTYEFRLVDPAEAKSLEVGAAAEPAAKAAAVAAPSTPAAVGQGKDLYGELLRYDDLRKRGIITDAEFDQIKKKLLNGG